MPVIPSQMSNLFLFLSYYYVHTINKLGKSTTQSLTEPLLARSNKVVMRIVISYIQANLCAYLPGFKNAESFNQPPHRFTQLAY